MDKLYDIAVIGGGIVGVATFYPTSETFSEKELVLLEKENVLAKHQTEIILA